jgi:hypothetical protein
MEKKMPEECKECEFEDSVGIVTYCSFGGECFCKGCENNLDGRVCKICKD